MVDFHTHVLPNLDDGSKDIEQSLEMLHMLHQQGVTHVVASSHFYAYKKSIEKYIYDRNESYKILQPYLDNDCPEIILGAEILYFPGIGKCKDLNTLKIQGTSMVLLEMPFESWNSDVLSDIEYILNNLELDVVIAHVDRYIKYKHNKQYIKHLLNLGVKLQVNNEALKYFKTRSWVIKQLKKDNIYAFGSDCHNMKSRKPNWEYLNKYCNKKNKDYIQQISKCSL